MCCNLLLGMKFDTHISVYMQLRDTISRKYRYHLYAGYSTLTRALLVYNVLCQGWVDEKYTTTQIAVSTKRLDITLEKCRHYEQGGCPT